MNQRKVHAQENFLLYNPLSQEIIMKKSLASLAFSALLATTALAALPAAAQEAYPQKPILALIAFPAGGGTDIVARSILKTAEKYSGKGFVVDNRPGAGGSIGFTAMAGAPKDGYTIGFINVPTIIMNPIQLGEKVKYKIDDFVPIANFVSDPGVFAVKADSPYKTLKDFIEAAKANPGKLKLAYGGPGTSESLAIRTLEQRLGLKFRKVPFEGTAPQLTALMGGHIDIMISNASEIYTQVEAGTIRAVAVGSEKPIAMYPDVGTYKDSGFDYVQVAMRGLAAPKGMDPKQIQFLEGVMKKAYDDPEFKENAKKLHLPLSYLNAEEFAREIKRLDAFYREEFAKSPW